MHVPDGILPGSVVIAGYAVTGMAAYISLKNINKKENPREDIPKASILTAAFLVASLIHVPIPPVSVHLALNGIMGVLLGYYAFPAIIISLFFQAVLFGHGGLTTLGINSVILGLPAFISFFIYNNSKSFVKGNRFRLGLVGFVVGGLALGLSVLIFFLILVNFIPANIDVVAEKQAIYTLSIAHIPLVIIEGIFTAFLFIYLKKVQPRLMGLDEKVSN
ncbi:MAG: cobalamin biosynthesis protein CbiM [Peptococcaceae bacterium BICA1-8]|nr:MAG: cobalamin biosynthesis protein CbiM [Peptococcaceae bacterium BICA1-8]